MAQITPIRNAYQKIKRGDEVLVKSFGNMILATVTSKGPLGFLAVTINSTGEEKTAHSSDVVEILRGEETIR